VNASVRRINYGVTAETLNITVYANTTIIGTLMGAPVVSRNSTTFSLACNTSSLLYGKYILKAVIFALQGEIDKTDNTRDDGMIRITILGDYNGDGTVDYNDLNLLRLAWQSRHGQANYNPNTDFNMDGIVNVKDFAMIGLNWQKHA
jgi:hypothetical protein